MVLSISRAQIFTACDGLEYKGKEKGHTNVLTLKGQSNVSIATFQRASRHLFSANQPASLSVAPQGMHIGDDIVMSAI